MTNPVPQDGFRELVGRLGYSDQDADALEEKVAELEGKLASEKSSSWSGVHDRMRRAFPLTAKSTEAVWGREAWERLAVAVDRFVAHAEFCESCSTGAGESGGYCDGGRAAIGMARTEVWRAE
jgi:hypothetical protein